MVKISKFITKICSKISESKQPEQTFKNVATSTSNSLPNHIAINSEHFPKYAHVISHKDKGGGLVIGVMPDNYMELVSREFVEESTHISRFGKDKGKIVVTPAHVEEMYHMRSHYHIDKLWSTGKGSGTNTIKDIVRRSLQDPETQGRVVLEACCIDGKTCPSGFYYKLGFRFKSPDLNEKFEAWLKSGGARENAPFYTGIMFLPKENISHCLNYGSHI